MENKLQELTQKLYNEGLSKGQAEADQLIATARATAEKLIATAQKEADALVETAKMRADKLRANMLAELTLSCRQMVDECKREIEGVITHRSIASGVSSANTDTQFIKEMLLTVAAGWSASSDEKMELAAILPADKQAEFAAFAQEAATKNLNSELTLTFDNRLKSGFRIGPKDGGYYLSFTDGEFNSLLKDFLRPQVKELLFGEKE